MRSSRLGRVLARALMLLGAAVVSGCAADAELDTFAPQGPHR